MKKMGILKYIYTLLTIVATSFSCSQVGAGDKSELEILGFSQDGKLFSILQSGVQDGSGFPYSELTVVDVEKDAIYAPLTRRFLKEDDRAESSQARQELLTEFGPALRKSGIEYVFVSPELRTPPTQPSVVEKKLDGGISVTAEAASFPLTGSADCESVGAKTVGFVLEVKVNGIAVAASVDKRVPASRGCPLAYRLHSIHTLPTMSQTLSLAVIVEYDRQGFEGPDTRYLVVTKRVSTGKT